MGKMKHYSNTCLSNPFPRSQLATILCQRSWQRTLYIFYSRSIVQCGTCLYRKHSKHTYMLKLIQSRVEGNQIWRQIQSLSRRRHMLELMVIHAVCETEYNVKWLICPHLLNLAPLDQIVSHRN